MREVPKLLVIVGETASGKSELALRLAEKFDGEIIAADSRTVYRGMDIGTAKPTTAERARVAHHLLDVAEPDQQFTAADFKKLAQAAIDDISARGKLSIMAGGSGLYVDSLLFDYKFRPPHSASREYLSKKSVNELQLMLLERGIELPNNPENPRHLIRALETDGLAAVKSDLRDNTLIIGLQPSREDLISRLEKRADDMLEAGLIKEIRGLARRYGWEASAMQAPAYRAFREYIEGRESLSQARQTFIRYDLALAKRQRTWFKRNKSIQWFNTPVNQTAIVDCVTTFLFK